MPQLHAVIILSDDEKGLVREALSAKRAKEVTDEILKGLKDTPAVTKITQGAQLNADTVRAAVAELETKGNVLSALPASEVRDGYLADINRALTTLREAQNMIAGQSHQ